MYCISCFVFQTLFYASWIWNWMWMSLSYDKDKMQWEYFCDLMFDEDEMQLVMSVSYDEDKI